MSFLVSPYAYKKFSTISKVPGETGCGSYILSFDGNYFSRGAALLLLVALEKDLATLTRVSSSARPLLDACDERCDASADNLSFFSFSIGIKLETLEFEREIATTELNRILKLK